MAKYEYSAKTKDSKTIKETGVFSSKQEVITHLKSKGLFIISIKEVGGRAREIKKARITRSKGKHNSVKLADLTDFARNLAITLSSGVTLLRSLEVIASQNASVKLEKILKTCCQDIRNGLSLCESLAKHPNVFSPLWIGIIRVGEASGNLPFVLDKLTEYLELKMEFERKVIGALFYPAILMFVAVGAVFIFLKFIFPKFSGLFMQFNIELPAITKFVFGASDFLARNFMIFMIIGAGAIAAIVVLRKNPEVMKMWDVVSLKIPLLGSLLSLIYIERITSTIYILLDSGLPIVYTLETTAQSVGNSVFEKKITFIGQRVRSGNPLSDEFNRQGIFPPLVSEMARIGEESGTMPNVFEKISKHFRRDLTTRVERLITLFEPVMIVVMGAVIGALVVALFLPLFKMSAMAG